MSLQNQINQETLQVQEKNESVRKSSSCLDTKMLTCLGNLGEIDDELNEQMKISESNSVSSESEKSASVTNKRTMGSRASQQLKLLESK